MGIPSQEMSYELCCPGTKPQSTAEICVRDWTSFWRCQLSGVVRKLFSKARKTSIRTGFIPPWDPSCHPAVTHAQRERRNNPRNVALLGGQRSLRLPAQRSRAHVTAGTSGFYLEVPHSFQHTRTHTHTQCVSGRTAWRGHCWKRRKKYAGILTCNSVKSCWQFGLFIYSLEFFPFFNSHLNIWKRNLAFKILKSIYSTSYSRYSNPAALKISSDIFQKSLHSSLNSIRYTHTTTGPKEGIAQYH